MNARDTLALVDHILFAVDQELKQWWEALDMMSFIGQDVPMKLWTNDDPPITVTLANMKNTLLPEKPVRVMHFKDGEWGQVGTAVLDPNTGVVKATVTEDIPELRMGANDAYHIEPRGNLEPTHPERWAKHITFKQKDIQTDTPLAHFTMHLDGSVTDNYTGEKIVQAYDPNENVPKVNPPFEGFENHPFFDKEN